MKDWFDYRHERALLFRADGLSLSAIAAHFGVPRAIARVWLEGPKKTPKRPRATLVRREKHGYRDTTAHDARIDAHKRRVEQQL